ncbi:CK1 family protein kinase [Tritrichomonas foetus]|uniref:non-specific serine/threonine protein kinase n=1 Tax=Tritrichomonas foetus TaxID=1144522 RepID=A0A1J4KK82_9EUKA|nr:CK1 family protein kinase [Tritrichomonas foetus]|eukprot:OHT10086.1 CK1 family protein kinase [Tritrichomonas foetus]
MSEDSEDFGCTFLTYKTKVDNYYVDRLIGEGGYGQIYDVYIDNSLLDPSALDALINIRETQPVFSANQNINPNHSGSLIAPKTTPINVYNTHNRASLSTHHNSIGNNSLSHNSSNLTNSVRQTRHFAMKIEYLNNPKSGLKLETAILKDIQTCDYFPKYVKSGTTNKYRYLIMELLGPSLSTLRKATDTKCFSRYSYLHLGLHMIRCIEELHKLGYLHRDIKPGNFLVRPNRQKPLVLIDFGLSRSYVKKGTGAHKQPRSEPGYTGTVRYASLHAHDEEELSRRDDLISWFYSMIEMATGQTPWPGSDNKTLVRRMKSSFTKEQLCKTFPPQFKTIYDLIFNLGYEDEPKYSQITNLIMQAIKTCSFPSHQYEWETFSKDRMKLLSPIPLDMGETSDVEERRRAEAALVEERRQRERQRRMQEDEEDREDGCSPCIIC